MSRKCCVNNCLSRIKVYNSLRLHTVRENWYHLFRETKGQNIPNQHSRICSLHFSAEDYRLKDRLLKSFHKWQLSEDATPKLEDITTTHTGTGTMDNDPIMMCLDFFENDLNNCQDDLNYSTINNKKEDDDNQSLSFDNQEHLEILGSFENVEEPVTDYKSTKSRRCIVKHCTSKTKTNHVLRFHKVRENWYYLFKEVVGQKCPNRYSKICSLHFNVEDYLLRDRLLKPFYKWQLAENATPKISKRSTIQNNGTPMICLDFFQNDLSNYQEELKYSTIDNSSFVDHQNHHSWRGCCVNHCSSTFTDNSKLRFHKVRENWYNLFNEIKEQQIPNQYSRICSLHFIVEDYELRDRLLNPFHKWKLSEDAIPKLTELSKHPLRESNKEMMCLDFFENDLKIYQEEMKHSIVDKTYINQNNINLALDKNHRWRGCCVHNCESNARINQFLRFHNIRESWYHLFEDIKGQKMPNQNSRICSLHFSVDDYELEDRLLKSFHKWKLSKNIKPKNLIIKKPAPANNDSPLLCLNFSQKEFSLYQRDLKQSTIVNNQTNMKNLDNKNSHSENFIGVYDIPENVTISREEDISNVERLQIDFINKKERISNNDMEDISNASGRQIMLENILSNTNLIGCALFTCLNSKLICQEQGLNVTFYKFPLKDNLKKYWKDFCFFNSYVNTETLYLCSDHFTDDSFMHNGALKIDAIPLVRTKNGEKRKLCENNVGDNYDDVTNLNFQDVDRHIEKLSSEELLKEDMLNDNINNANSIEENFCDDRNIVDDDEISSDGEIEDLFEFTVEPKIYKCIKVNDGYQCEVCTRVLKTLNSYIQHSLCHADRSLLCSICGKVLPSYKKLNQHENQCRKKKTDNNQILNEASPRNTKVFQKLNGKSNITTIGKVRHSKGPFICDICKKSFITRKNLDSHKKNHLEKIYKCDECKQKLISQSKLKYHKLIHHIYDIRCDHCDKLFSRMQYYKHMDHMNRQRRKCKNCKRTFGNDFVYNEHIQKCKILIDSKKEFYCIFCEMIINVNINEHITSIEHINMEKEWTNQFYNGEDCTVIDFICNECEDICFSDFSLYVYHQEIKHNKNRNDFVKEFFKIT